MTATSVTPAESGFGAEGGVVLPPRPYPGLRPFERDEWPVYFGRERMSDEVVARLIRQHMVFVHGDSGCGKSSLVRAGVFARLEQGAAGASWRTAIALPRQAPLWNVAEALAGVAGEGDAGEHEARVLDWRRALNCGRDAPAAIAELLARGAGGPVCLLIDQFEELFQHARLFGADEARLLATVLIALYENPPEGFYVAMTMRSEYLGACARFEGFAELVNATQYLLPRMAREDMLRAIREPALLYDGQVSREMADRLIADVGGGQDQLPLIQHGLMRFYRKHVGAVSSGAWKIGIEDFPARGGLSGMLSAHADVVAKAVQRLIDPGARGRLVEELFRALTDVNADGQAIRRPQTLEQLAALTGVGVGVVREVVDVFRSDGVSFLSPYGSKMLAPDDLVEVSHEALIRCWRALADSADGWLVRELRDGLVWRSLVVHGESFERDPQNVLAPAVAEERETWLKRRNPTWAARYGGGWERVTRMIKASVDARDRAQKDAAEALRREGRASLMRIGLAVLGTLVVMLFLALDYAYDQIGESKVQFASAEATRSSNTDLVAELAAARERGDELKRQLEETVKTLEMAKAGMPSFGSNLPFGYITRSIAAAHGTLTEPAAAPVKVTGPRLYVHIAEDSQRTAAHALEQALAQTKIDKQPLILPGIQWVKEFPSNAQLRCFERTECETFALRVLKEINSRLASPKVELADMSERYGNTQVLPGQLELWFPRGEIVLRGTR